MQDDVLDWLWFAVWFARRGVRRGQIGRVVQRLVGRARPRVDIPAGHRDQDVRVDAVLVASALDDASWIVAAFWETSCACPEPPHPAAQLELLDWCWPADSFVDADVRRRRVRRVRVVCWVAELEPPDNVPPRS